MEKNPDIQFRSPEEIKSYQETRLIETLVYLQAHSRFYQQMFREHSIDISRIRQTCNYIIMSLSVLIEMLSSIM